jgi:methylenetetrahydrofolate reductase (NADPH)
MKTDQTLRRSRRQDRDDIAISFEFFPPKTQEMETALWEAIDRLAPLAPDFVSVTYGAGGTTRERTHATVARLVQETSLKPAAHLTCVGSTCDEINVILDGYKDAGVRHIVALRGDPPSGLGSTYQAHPEGFASTADLVAAARNRGDFEVSVSAYPEKHPESATFDVDLDVLQAKIDAGATRAITQFFFDNEVYFRFLDKAHKRGITIPILPGIVPVLNFKQTSNFASRCGASVPAWLAHRFEGLDHDPATRRLIAAAVAAEQVFDLLDQGISHFHFYTMNKADLVYAICHLIGVRALPNGDRSEGDQV